MHTKLQTWYDTLYNQQAELFAFLKSYTNDQLNTQPQPGSWSPLQVVQHMILVEKGSMAYMQKKLHYRTNIPKANLLTYIRARFMNIGFQAPIKFKAPKVARSVGESHQLEILEKQWIDQRTQLEQFLEEYPPELMENCVFKHPLAGRLTVYQALSFFSFHLNRHEKQIRRALKKL